jgi:hypothetical protein
MLPPGDRGVAYGALDGQSDEQLPLFEGEGDVIGRIERPRRGFLEPRHAWKVSTLAFYQSATYDARLSHVTQETTQYLTSLFCYIKAAFVLRSTTPHPSLR